MKENQVEVQKKEDAGLKIFTISGHYSISDWIDYLKPPHYYTSRQNFPIILQYNELLEGVVNNNFNRKGTGILNHLLE